MSALQKHHDSASSELRPTPSPDETLLRGTACDPRHNRLLAALSDDDWLHWRHHLEHVELPLGHVLYESGATLSHAYFPTSAIVANLYLMEDGTTAGVAVIGLDGMVGVPLIMGGGTMPSRAVVQSTGHAFRMTAQALKEACGRSEAALTLLLRYTQALISQMAQTAACNRLHAIDQQLCRFLLLSLDRLPGNELVMTQELIAGMLGVRREGVTEAAGRLQKLGLIHYARGHITVLDRQGLEQRSCECYAVVRREYERLLAPSSRRP